MLFLAREKVRVDARLLRHVVVDHQAGNGGLKLFRVQTLVLELPVKAAPIHALRDGERSRDLLS